MSNPHCDSLTVRRILKVNHAGEHGAIQIYSAQIALARRYYPDIVDKLAEMRGHEVVHRARFRHAMPARAARPCRVMSLWSVGGWVLGFATALMGRKAVWICTAAVEATVHRHLDDQLKFLAGRDADLHALISSIRVDEEAHLQYAEGRIDCASRGALVYVLIPTITAITDMLIWLSTWGDSTRMARELRAASG